jgi:hypothetical protein
MNLKSKLKDAKLAVVGGVVAAALGVGVGVAVLSGGEPVSTPTPTPTPAPAPTATATLEAIVTTPTATVPPDAETPAPESKYGVVTVGESFPVVSYKNDANGVEWSVNVAEGIEEKVLEASHGEVLVSPSDFNIVGYVEDIEHKEVIVYGNVDVLNTGGVAEVNIRDSSTGKLKRALSYTSTKLHSVASLNGVVVREGVVKDYVVVMGDTARDDIFIRSRGVNIELSVPFIELWERDENGELAEKPTYIIVVNKLEGYATDPELVSLANGVSGLEFTTVTWNPWAVEDKRYGTHVEEFSKLLEMQSGSVLYKYK